MQEVSENLAKQTRQAIYKLHKILGIPIDEGGYSLLELIELVEISLNTEYERAESFSEELYKLQNAVIIAEDVVATDNFA